MRTRLSKRSTTATGGRPRRKDKTRANPEATGAGLSLDENYAKSLRLVLSFVSDAQEEMRYLRRQKQSIAMRVYKVAKQVHRVEKIEENMQELREITKHVNRVSSILDALSDKSDEIESVIEEMERAWPTVHNV